jgi:hypothetical protein
VKAVYIAHPLGSGPERELNRQRAAKWVAWAARQGVAPVADWIILSGEWSETPENRERGLLIDCALVALCDEVWLVGGRVSTGMQIEADAARCAGRRVVDLTHLGAMPPGAPS